jgi:hypothetical protein
MSEDMRSASLRGSPAARMTAHHALTIALRDVAALPERIQSAAPTVLEASLARMGFAVLNVAEEREIREWLSKLPDDHVEDALTQFGVKKSRRPKLRPIITAAIASALGQEYERWASEASAEAKPKP